MRLTHFRIENFKGIQDLTLDFTKAPSSPIYALVGLNESGKTTILEALDSFAYRDERLDIVAPRWRSVEPIDLVPMPERGHFTGDVKLTGYFSLTEEDKSYLRARLTEEINYCPTLSATQFAVDDKLSFKNSVVDKSVIRSTIWLDLSGRYNGRGRERKYKQEDWKAISNALRSLIPGILYFPNFLFDIPDLINLEPATDETQVNKFYREVFTDVLTAFRSGLSLQENLVKLARSKKGSDTQTLDNLLLHLSKFVSDGVFDAWNEVFVRPIHNKEIIFKVTAASKGVWLNILIRDGYQSYSLKNRSLGFRWFFVFFLLTQFRRHRTETRREVIYMFDEPASNLHPAAQQQLLKTLPRLAQNGMVLYSTHSQHLINPHWLEGTFVVKNEAILYDQVDQETTGPTFITAERYRSFVAKHPSQTTYYQPILDVINYQPSALEYIPDVIMVEGKNDYYVLTYFSKVVLGSQLSISLLPGSGAGSLDTAIRLYSAWGREFAILLDSDAEGEKQQDRYSKIFGTLVEGRTHTLAQILESNGKEEMESCISKADVELIRATLMPNVKALSKTQLNRCIQELLAREQALSFSTETVSRMAFLVARLGSLISGSRTTAPAE